MLAVTYFYREPRKTGLSIEGIFHSVEACLKDRIEISDFYCDANLSRLQNIREARKHAGEINHITGDVNFLAMGLRGKKTILTVHDLGYYENPVHSKVKKAFYELFWFTLPLKYVDIVTVVSEFTKNKLVEYFRFPEDRIRVIPDPVKPAFHFVKKEEISSKPVVLMMGTGKHKNLDNLIEAARGMDIHIDIIGWPAPDELQRLDEYKISYTVYNGLTDEQVQERYEACDMLFMASHYEGFGMPIIEAQTVGRPVITSNIGAMLEVADDSCLLVDPKSYLEIRNAIAALSDRRLYDKLVAKGIVNAAKYDYRFIADEYLSVYEELNKLKG
jgi:glycosyltransferase involved in cell wall biosynthesis